LSHKDPITVFVATLLLSYRCIDPLALSWLARSSTWPHKAPPDCLQFAHASQPRGEDVGEQSFEKRDSVSILTRNPHGQGHTRIAPLKGDAYSTYDYLKILFWSLKMWVHPYVCRRLWPTRVDASVIVSRQKREQAV